MIEIKTLFKGWIPVSKERALEYAKKLYYGIKTMKEDECVEYINTKKIRGISFTREELENKKVDRI